MKHISQILESLESKYMPRNRTFFSMDEFPLPNPEAPDMSIQVLLYDKHDLRNVYIGFYNFDLKKWLAFGNEENVCEFACWCYVPKPDIYIQMIGRGRRNLNITEVQVIESGQGKTIVPTGLGKGIQVAEKPVIDTHECIKFTFKGNKFVCKECGGKYGKISYDDIKPYNVIP